jgi:hypothetical protein
MNTEKPISIIEIMFFSGLKYFKEKEKIIINLFKDKLTINDNFILPLERIKNVYIDEDVKIKQEDKSVIGRGILGFLVAGPIGAVVGSASGIGKKEIKNVTKYLIINYIDKNNNDNMLKFIIYSNWGYDKVAQEFVEKVKQKVNIDKEKEIEQYREILNYPHEI